MDNKSQAGNQGALTSAKKGVPVSVGPTKHNNHLAGKQGAVASAKKGEVISVGVMEDSGSDAGEKEVVSVGATRDDEIVDNDFLVNGLQSITEIAEGESRITKTKSALKHFNFFLIWFWKNNDTSSHAQYKSYKDITYFCLQHTEFFGQFATYLANHAKHGCDASSPNSLSLNSALGYFSAVKNYFLDLFKAEEDLPCFWYRNWKQ